MWQPTTTTAAANTASDNKKKEVEDCKCSDAPAALASAAAGCGSGGNGNHKQQQQQNIFEKNSNKKHQPTLPFGGNLSTSEEKGGSVGETSDSGFISGPQEQTELELDQEQLGARGDDAGAIGGGFGNSKEAYEAEEKTVLDSGCIDEVEDFAEDEYDAIVGTHEAEPLQFAEQSSTQNVTAAASTPIPIAAPPPPPPTLRSYSSGQMKFAHNVDAGMSEWFCNLSLETETAPRSMRPHPQTHSQQQLTGSSGAVGINNLDAVSAQKFHNQNKSAPQLQQQQQAMPTTNLTPTNAWEQFYQQNDDGDTPLHLACISGYVNVVAALIRMAPHPCLFNIQNDEAQTALHLATLTAQPKIIRMLLIAGAEPTVRDRHGNTALHLACSAGEEQCVSALTMPIGASEINEAHRLYGHLSNDKTTSYLSCAHLPSDLEIRNYDGERCVHLAAQAGHIDILRILVLYGADINAREGKSGRTPLHIAIECCNEDLANFLLDECQKLNLETATYAGLTAYQVACILNKSQMLHILEKRGAEPLTPPDSDYDSSDIETDLDDTKTYDRFGDPGYFSNYNGCNPMTVA